MRPLVSALVLLAVTLAPGAVFGHSLDAPSAVQTNPDGTFSFDWVFTAGPGEAAIESIFVSGIDVTGVDHVSDCGCDPGCIVAEGDTVAQTVSGQLTNLNVQGQVFVEVFTCPSGPPLFTVTDILIPGSPPPLSCDIGDPCEIGVNTEVAIGNAFTAYLLLRNYDNVAGVQTAFDWGNWQFLASVWNCQSSQLSATSPTPPGGPVHGTIATAFDCVTGGQTAVIGTLLLVPTTPGCLTQVDSAFPFGTHVVSCDAQVTPINPPNLGSICAGATGIDACELVVLPDASGGNENTALPMHAIEIGPTTVEPVTWGDLKNRYRR